MSGDSNLSRRDFLLAGMAAAAANASVSGSALITIDNFEMASRADITYTTPVSRSEEGLPIGNGRVGTLVWTTPNALHMQINRVDVFANGCESRSFSERHTDYSNGCGYVDISFPGMDDVFVQGEFSQRLSVADGLVITRGGPITLRAFAWNRQDVIAIDVEDGRKSPGLIDIDLRMLRYVRQYQPQKNFELTRTHSVAVKHRGHTATSKLDIREGRIALGQRFEEDAFFCASAIGITVVGRKSKARFVDETTVRLTVQPGFGRFTILIGTMAGFDPKADNSGRVLEDLVLASQTSVDDMLAQNREWWQQFWSKSFVYLRSSDRTAELVQTSYSYFLYIMASCSRGAYIPRFGGLLFQTNGDMRQWGAQHWWHNASCYYDAIPPTGHFDLLDPAYEMYSRLTPSLERAARQQWGSEGMWIPETVWFDGLENLPEEIAAEMRELYLLKKPWAERSQRFMEYAVTKHPHSSRWNWRGQSAWVDGRMISGDKGAGPFGDVVHIYSTGAKVAHLYWQRYLLTMDQRWLRNRAYPMLKGVAEFYRHHPKLTRDSDGKYHIHDVNDHEPVKGAQDTLEEISAMRWLFPVATRAAELLQTDEYLRAEWTEIARNLAPLPTNDLPGSMGPRAANEKRMFSNGRTPVVQGKPSKGSDHLLTPAIHYGLINVATPDKALLETANATFDSVFPQGVTPSTPVPVLSRVALAAAHLGRGAELRNILPNQIRCLAPERDWCDWDGVGRIGVMRNRMTLREGPGAIDCQRLGRVAAALHESLLQCASPDPAAEPITHVFAAWPQDWNAAFSLLAAGAFQVTSSIRAGNVEFVEAHSLRGEEFRLKNPWGAQASLSLFRDGKPDAAPSGDILRIPTIMGERIIIARADTDLKSLRRILD